MRGGLDIEREEPKGPGELDSFGEWRQPVHQLAVPLMDRRSTDAPTHDWSRGLMPPSALLTALAMRYSVSRAAVAWGAWLRVACS